MTLFLTLISGLFFLVGLFVYKHSKNKVNISNMSYGCALVVVLGLILTDLVPEVLEDFKWYSILFIILGLCLFIIIDKFVPHHHHDHKEHDEEGMDHKNHLEHISIITIFALILHNAVEGMALYNVALNDLKAGILMLIGIGLHNLPFGFQIGAMSDSIKHKGLMFLLVISGFIGGVIAFIFGSIPGVIETIVLSLTIGMLLHICIFEFLGEVIQNIKNKSTIYGIVIGLIILILINII